mmetsp:Transcript_46241/g.128674  ORF Transcript_46241/g.128674 Transcript_46241/m.128674 type:complete len:308 (-) Transcript_46241:1168-2091(-)
MLTSRPLWLVSSAEPGEGSPGSGEVAFADLLVPLQLAGVSSAGSPASIDSSSATGASNLSSPRAGGRGRPTRLVPFGVPAPVPAPGIATVFSLLAPSETSPPPFVTRPSRTSPPAMSLGWPAPRRASVAAACSSLSAAAEVGVDTPEPAASSSSVEGSLCRGRPMLAEVPAAPVSRAPPWPPRTPRDAGSENERSFVSEKFRLSSPPPGRCRRSVCSVIEKSNVSFAGSSALGPCSGRRHSRTSATCAASSSSRALSASSGGMALALPPGLMPTFRGAKASTSFLTTPTVSSAAEIRCRSSSNCFCA